MTKTIKRKERTGRKRKNRQTNVTSGQERTTNKKGNLGSPRLISTKFEGQSITVVRTVQTKTIKENGKV